MSGPTHPLAGRRRRRIAASSALLLLLAACGGSDDEGASATTEPSVETTAAPAPTTTPPTTAPAPTTEPAPTTAAPTTAAPTTVADTTTSTIEVTTTTSTLVVDAPTTTIRVEAPEEPIAPPADAFAQEPIIEVGSIAIPKLGVDMTMYEGIRLTTLDYGPGHWPGTAMPGEVGNVVVGGHRTSSHRVFRDVDQLVAGDEIVFNDERGTHTYAVDRVEIVEPTAVWIVNPTETATATLFACHPPGSTAQRIVVFADYVAST